MQATSSDNDKVPTECTPATLRFEGKVVRIYLESSNQRVAVIVSNALQLLVSKFAVTLTATICGKKSRYISFRETGERGKKKVVGAQFYSTRIVVYGFLQQKEKVANILAGEELFFQHPGETEFDRRVKYMNPHYLLPHGDDMPPIEELSIFRCCVGRSSDSLEECEKNQVLKIFEAANEPIGDLMTIQPSPRLVTKLKRYYILALAT
jgi:SWI/SNF-related matrix-associated actin-dependent regulator of chromatin subfamily A3